MSICGLDFGTSNTTLGTIEGQEPVLAELEAGETTIPSAIFYEVDGAVLIGRRAIAAYVDGAPGRLMRSLKSVLGTSLIDETTRLGRQRTGFRDVIASYLGAVKRGAEQATGLELRDVVHGRPVHFVDNEPDADRKAEETLRQIAREVGFDDVTFQFEPIAAALDYERQIESEEIALIADIGGGTSDFSIVRLGPERHAKANRSSDILANDGTRIGGTDFDRQLSLGVVMPLFGFGSAMSRAGQLPARIAARIKTCLTQAQLTAGDIDAVFLTGGSVRLAHVRNAIKKAVPSARLVEGDTFGAVGKGLTLEALRRYGPRA